MQDSSSPLVSVKQVTKTFRRGSEEICVLDQLDLQVQAGEFVALMVQELT